MYDTYYCFRRKKNIKNTPETIKGGEVKAEAYRFWKPIIYNNGKLDIKQILRELGDYSFILDEVPKVYCHATGGLLSKTNYYAKGVISAIDDFNERTINETIQEYIDDGLLIPTKAGQKYWDKKIGGKQQPGTQLLRGEGK